MAQESFSDYHLYTLDRKTSINNNQTKQVSMLGATGFPVRKRYVVDGSAFYYRNAHQPGSALKDDVKVIYQQPHTDVDINAVPEVFRPRTGTFELIDLEKIFAADPDDDIFGLRGVDRGGVVVVVRPDQYVAQIVPLEATDVLGRFFAPLAPQK